jgi:hypothetical protein
MSSETFAFLCRNRNPTIALPYGRAKTRRIAKDVAVSQSVEPPKVSPLKAIGIARISTEWLSRPRGSEPCTRFPYHSTNIQCLGIAAECRLGNRVSFAPWPVRGGGLVDLQ